jgi:hypothetical protein
VFWRRGWAYRKPRGTTVESFGDDTFRLYGSLQRAWLHSAQSSASHCVWRDRSQQMRNNSVGADERVLTVSAVQAPSRIVPRAGFFLHEITHSFDDHQSTTPFTQHVVFSWCLSFVSLCRAMVAVTDSTSASLWTSARTVSVMQRPRRRQVHSERLVVRQLQSTLEWIQGNEGLSSEQRGGFDCVR